MVRVHRDAGTVARWEKGRTDMDSAAEALVRKRAVELPELDVKDATTDALSKKCVPTADAQPITITARDDGRHYA